MRKLEALLAFLDDAKPAPGPASARPARRPPQARTVFCDACGGAGRGSLQAPCDRCNGTGRVRMPMDVADRKRMDSWWGEISRATGTIALPVPGDFDRLRSAVNELHFEARELVWLVYVERSEKPGDLPGGDQLMLRLAMRYLDERLKDLYVPHEIMEWAAQPRTAGTGRWANQYAQERRDRMVWRMVREEGMSATKCATELGLHKSTVSRALRRMQGSPDHTR